MTLLAWHRRRQRCRLIRCWQRQWRDCRRRIAMTYTVLSVVVRSAWRRRQVRPILCHYTAVPGLPRPCPCLSRLYLPSSVPYCGDTVRRDVIAYFRRLLNTPRLLPRTNLSTSEPRIWHWLITVSYWGIWREQFYVVAWLNVPLSHCSLPTSLLP